MSILAASFCAQGMDLIDVPEDFPTIQAAVDALPDAGPLGTIYLAPGVYNENLDLTGKNVTIVGNPFDPEQVVIDGFGGQSTIGIGSFEGEDCLVSLLGVTIIGGSGFPHAITGHTYGGGLRLDPGTSAQLWSSVVRDNHAWYGGGIYANSQSRLELHNSFVTGNHGEYKGGGLMALGSLVVDGCTFVQNQSFMGGHICMEGRYTSVLIEDSTFRNGLALFQETLAETGYRSVGGAIASQNSHGSVTIRRCDFDRNISAWAGGAIGFLPFSPFQLESCEDQAFPCADGRPMVEDCTFTNCLASAGAGIAWNQLGGIDAGRLVFDTCVASTGGGFHALRGEHVLEDCTFVNCATTHAGRGGGIACEAGSLQMTGSTFDACMAHGGAGGGLFLVDAVLAMSDCRFLGNESEAPGCALHAVRSSVGDQYSEFRDHVASTAVFMDMESMSGTSEFNRTLFQDNGRFADTAHGAVLLQADPAEGGAPQSLCRFTTCTFEGNESSADGGAIRSLGMDVDVKAGTFRSNSTKGGFADGGAISIEDAAISIALAEFDRNTSGRDGGAIQLVRAQCVVRGCSFSGNRANDYGGSIESILDSVLVVEHSDFTGGPGLTARYGGAIDIDGSAGPAWFYGLEVSGCSVEHLGGGVYSDGPDTRFSRSRISGNTAWNGGGLGTSVHAGLVEQSRICGNTVGQILGPWEDGGGNVVAEVCCDADLDGDGRVDGADLTMLLSEFGSDGTGVFGSDMDGDGRVDGSDLTMLLGEWGGCD